MQQALTRLPLSVSLSLPRPSCGLRCAARLHHNDKQRITRQTVNKIEEPGNYLHCKLLSARSCVARSAPPPCSCPCSHNQNKRQQSQQTPVPGCQLHRLSLGGRSLLRVYLVYFHSECRMRAQFLSQYQKGANKTSRAEMEAVAGCAMRFSLISNTVRRAFERARGVCVISFYFFIFNHFSNYAWNSPCM